MTQPLMVEASESDSNGSIQEARHVSGAIDKVFVIADLLKRFHHFVVFVPDLTDKLFDDVFQRDDALVPLNSSTMTARKRFVLLQKP